MSYRWSHIAAAATAATFSLGTVLYGSPWRSLEQTTRPTFVGGVQATQLDVIVLDALGRPVSTLTRDDLVVLEDGSPRPIVAFQAVDLTAAPAKDASANAALREVGTGVSNNELPREGRLVTILMDRSIPMEGPTITARRIANRVIDDLGPNDLAAIVFDSGFATEGRNQGFTADRAVLRAAVAAPFVGMVNPPAVTAGGLVRGEPDIRTTGDCYCGLCVLEAIQSAADALASERNRQKVMLWVGNRIVLQERPSDPTSCGGLIRPRFERVLQTLAHGNITFNTLDPAGLETWGATAENRTPRDPNTAASNLARQADLAVLPSATGGRTIVNTNAPEEGVDKIFSETSSYYLLGFSSDDPGTQPKRHRIEVHVKHGHYTVRARSVGFGATDARTTDPAHVDSVDALEAAVAGLLPKTDIPLSLAVTPRFGGESDTEIVPLLEIGGVPLSSDFDVLVGVFDEKARPVVSQRQVVTPSGPARGAAVPLAPMPLKPGHYEVRVGVQPRGTDRAASVYASVEIPNLDNGRVTLSGVTLQALPGPSGAALLGTDPILTAPTLRRRFAPTERVSAFAQVHVQRREDAPVVRLLIEDSRRQIIAEAPVSIDMSALHDHGIAGIRADVPVGALPPGTYLLAIDAALDDGHARRELRFEVR
jgi:VWFA-related protein